MSNFLLVCPENQSNKEKNGHYMNTYAKKKNRWYKYIH